MDPSIVGANLGGPVAIAVITSYLKPFIEQRWKPNDPLHDTIIRLIALVLGLVGYVANYAGSASTVTFAGLENAAGAGFLAAAGAVVTYHLVTAVGTPPSTDPLAALNVAVTTLAEKFENFSSANSVAGLVAGKVVGEDYSSQLALGGSSTAFLGNKTTVTHLPAENSPDGKAVTTTISEPILPAAVEPAKLPTA